MKRYILTIIITILILTGGRAGYVWADDNPYMADLQRLILEAEENLKKIDQEIDIRRSLHQHSNPSILDQEEQLRQLRMEIALLKMEYTKSANITSSTSPAKKP